MTSRTGKSFEPRDFDIAVIGIAARFSGAPTVEQFWCNLAGGVESVTTLSESTLIESGVEAALLQNPRYVRAASVLEDADLFAANFFGINAREAAYLDPQHRVFLECAWEALEHAGYAPNACPGAVGVYAGAGPGTYLLNNLIHDPGFLSSGGLETAIGNDKDYLTTRVSYKLNLKGPSLTVQTACSSSLVAVHLACQALIAGDCDMALAGGVSVTIPQSVGYLYEPGGIGSPDGHCRAFDAAARGTVRGNGAGVVVLKRLHDALRDRDNIFAFVRGSAINNDGAQKVGYTAPSVEGQTRVILAAQTISETDPATISYVEAHGTATSVGDPIEIAALTRAFRGVDGRRRCAVGSVKTNIGHTDAAAGIAGFIKTVLALWHGVIPPSLHFRSPNPEIDFENSPFYVAAELANWPTAESPRRAAVSSFGIGGTNAHVILQEAPAVRAPVSVRTRQVLTVSARTPRSLDCAVSNLAERLETCTDPDLANVAYTLHVGRTQFPYRAAVACSNAASAAAALNGGRFARSVAPRPNPSVVFVFPGQGSQYPHAAGEIYRRELVFRDAFDECARRLKPILQVDIQKILYPDAGCAAEAAVRLEQTAMTQPVLFALEYALAKLWLHWGVQPAALIGHSLGEYVAACLAGVFSLEQALSTVARRGQLMQSAPPGSMMSVALSERDVEPLLGPGLSLAAVNSPGLCVVSGQPAAMAGFRRRLDASGVSAQPLHTSHAFHSQCMDEIVELFVDFLGGIDMHPPAIPIVSNFTGAFLRADDAVSPRYWARHLRHTVRFAAGIEELLKEDGRLFLEVGPGHTLTTLVRQTAGPGGVPAFPSLPRAGLDQSDSATLFETLGRLWVEGVDIDWRSFHELERLYRIPLPTYPFEKQRYWVEPATASAATAERGAADQPAVCTAVPRPDSAPTYREPGTEEEAALCKIWSSLLGFDPIGVADNFFEIGGHSLLGIQLAARVRDAFGVDLALSDIFESPTVEQMAAIIGSRRGVPSAAGALDLPRAVPRPEEEDLPFPLTEIQQAYWLGRSPSYELGDLGSHVYFELQSGGLDVDRAERALQRLIQRHGMLRSVILGDGTQRILREPVEYRVRRNDFRGLDATERELALERIRREMAHTPFDPQVWPMFDIRVSLLDAQMVRVHLKFDYLIADVSSLDIFMHEFSQLYEAPDMQLQPIEISFRDYMVAAAVLEKSQVYERSRAYWLDRVETLPPPPMLPLRKSSGSGTRPTLVRHNSRLGAVSWKALKDRALKMGVSPSVLLCAAFAQVLAAWSEDPHFTINLTLFNRLPLHPQVGQLIGDFTSTTLLEVDAAAGDFTSFVAAIQQQLWKDLDHRYFAGVRVLRELARLRGSGETAAMPVVFTSVLTNESASLPGGPDFGDVVFSTSQSPQILIDHQVGEERGDLVFAWDTLDAAFAEGVIENMFSAYERLLESLAHDDAKWTGPAPCLLPEPQRLQRESVNASVWPVSDTTLPALFAVQAGLRPDAPAVDCGGALFTYGELLRRSTAVAQRLRESDVGCGRLIPIIVENGGELVVGALGCMQAGAAYVPLNPNLPAERLGLLLEEAGAKAALTQRAVEPRVRWPEALIRICLDDMISATPENNPSQRPDDLAYVIYTSGSTGRPKGVMIDHRGAVNTILDINDRFAVGPGDRILGVSAFTFDLSVYDVFGALASGATVVIPPPSAHADAQAWARLVDERQITIWNSAPALMDMLLHAAGTRWRDRPGPLRLVLLSGDWIPRDLPDRVRQCFPHAQVISLGGATEGSIWSILYPIDVVDPGWKSIPYGKPMRNQRWYVLDCRGHDRPVWVPGELYIGGCGIARGYWRDPARTAESFIPHPVTGERLYRTGDLGRFLPDGNIEFLGRNDTQVKVRGHRIELGELESVLRSHPAVLDCVAVCTGTDASTKRIVAYAVARPETRGTREGESQHARSWGAVFDNAYDDSVCGEIGPNFAGWTSSYTGLPIPHEEMQVWLDSTVERLLALRPRRVLEIGAGLGLLMSRIAPVCEQYVATDLSPVAVSHLRACAEAGTLPMVTILNQAADDFSGFQPGAFDTVILNSVVQYFPSLEYFLRVLKGAAWAIGGEGHIFVGDVRSLPLLTAFHASVLLAHDSPGSKQQLQQLLRSRLERERELALAPEFFAGIRARVPEVAAAELRLKRGPARNELTRFRYDAVLRVGQLRPETIEMADLNWKWAALEDFSAWISRYSGTVVRISRIPNARVCSDIAGAGSIESASEQDIAAWEGRVQPDSLAVDPDDLMAACNQSGNQVELLVSRYGKSYFDAVIHSAATSPELVRTLVEAGPSLPSGPLANDPAAAREREELGAELKSYLQPKLPSFMVPAAVIVIDSLPLTPNGKVDRRTLESRSLPVQVESDNQAVAPRTEIERTLAGLWADVLGHVVLSVHDNFFEAGGNSLAAMQLLARIQQSFGVELSIKALFDCPTIAHVADQLAAAQSSSDQSGLEKVLRQIEHSSDEEVTGSLTG